MGVGRFVKGTAPEGIGAGYESRATVKSDNGSTARRAFPAVDRIYLSRFPTPVRAGRTRCESEVVNRSMCFVSLTRAGIRERRDENTRNAEWGGGKKKNKKIMIKKKNNKNKLRSGFDKLFADIE